MTVAELIKLLQEYPQEMLVVYQKYSEQVLLKDSDISIQELCYPRLDGWVQDNRPDMPSQKYLVLPGN